MNVAHVKTVNVVLSAMRWVPAFGDALWGFVNALEGSAMPSCHANDFFLKNLVKTSRMNSFRYFFQVNNCDNIIRELITNYQSF